MHTGEQGDCVKYSGRIFCLLITFLMLVMTKIWAFHNFNYPLDAPPSLGIVFLFVAYWAGYQYDKVRYCSERDALTALYNRRFIDDVFIMLSAQATRKNEKISIVIFDCNQFKVINDRYGHKIGDLVLKEMSAALLRCIRKSDAGVRWGGDEFLIIAPDTDRINIEKLIIRFEHELQKLSQKLQIEISVTSGLAVFPEDAKTLDNLVKIADKMMYSLKKPDSSHKYLLQPD